MGELLKTGLLYFMTEECYENYVYEHDFLDVSCFKALLSKGLGFGIILGSLLVKVPQILKILSNKSAEGINLFSVLLDLCAITCVMAYGFVNGFPFSSWGDCTFLAAQTGAIAALILLFGGSAVKSFLFVLFYAGICFVLMSGLTPVEFLWTMQGFNIPILVTGKLSQAWTNYKNGGTGQLSAATCFMLLAGSLARIFTSIQETGDSMMILTYCISSCANAVIVSQLMYYWNKPVAGTKKKVPQKQAKLVSPKTKSKSKKAD